MAILKDALVQGDLVVTGNINAEKIEATATTQAASDNSTNIATTAFVKTAITNAIGSALTASY